MYQLVIGLLLLLLLVAAWCDIRSRRIPNSLVFPGMIAGILSNILLPQVTGGLGILDSLAGLGVGLLLLLPLYLLRAMGAGDVKLMAMTGAFLGVHGTIGALPYVLLTGGVFALGFAWNKGMLRKALHNVQRMLFTDATRDSKARLSVIGNISDRSPVRSVDLPYGVAIAVGVIVYLAVSHWV